MMTVVMSARTVAVAKQYSTQTISRPDGSVDTIRSIYFRVATRRRYHNRERQYESDFFLAKATGPVADLLNNNCTALRQDGSGKLQSRHLLLIGSFETYTKTRSFNTNINGVTYTVPFEDRNNFVFVIDHVEFLDRKDGNNGNGNGGNATWIPGSQIMPQVVSAVPNGGTVAQAVPAQPVAAQAVQAVPQAVAAQAPIAQAVPVAHVAPAAQAAPVAQAVAAVAPQAAVAAAQPVVAPIPGAPVAQAPQAIPAPANTPMNIPELGDGTPVSPW